MADKIPDEVVIPSSSKYEVIDTVLNTGKNGKRLLSISESENEYNDHTDTFNCEASTNKRNLYQNNQSNAVCERTCEQSLSDVIQKLTQQIEQIEKNFAKCQNVMKNTEMNNVSCDDELIYQAPNKIIKHGSEIICTDSCNSDENSIGSNNKINTTKHVNKKIKLDENIIFQKDVDDSERDSKSLTNKEVEMLLEVSYKIDDKIIYDDEDNTHIKDNGVQTDDDSDLSIADQAHKFNTSMERVFNESMLDNNKISFSTEDQSLAENNDCSESSISQSAELMNIGDFRHVLEMCEDNGDNSIDRDEFLDLTKCDYDEIILDHENCTKDFDNVNSDILTDSEQKTQYSGDSKHEMDFESTIIQEGNSSESNEHLDDQESVCETLCNEEKNKFEASNTVDDLLDVGAGHPKNFSQNNFNGKELLHINEHVNDEIILDDENSTSKTNLEQMKKGTLKRLTIEEEEMLTKLINNKDDKSGKLTDCKDKITVSQTSENYINENISIKLKNQDDLVVTRHVFDENSCMTEERKNSYLSMADQAHKLNTSMEHVFNESMLDNNKISFSTEDQSLAENNDCSESSINKSAELVNIGDFRHVLEMCEDNGDNSIDRDEFLDLTKCDYDEIILEHENCISLSYEGINCARDFRSVNVQEGNSSKSNEHLDDQESVCETLNNEEKNKFEPSNTVDVLLYVDILDADHPKNVCGNNLNAKEFLDVNDETMLDTESSTSKTNPVQMNKSTLKRLTIEEEEMLTKLINNEDDKSGKLTDCKDKISVSQTSEDNINENIFKKMKNQDDLLEVTAHVFDENACIIKDKKRKAQSSDTGDQFVSNLFYFGTDNYRDVSVHTIHSLDDHEMNNCSRNNTTVPSSENNDSLISLNYEKENSTVELYCNSVNKTLLRIKNKSDSNEEESVGGLMKQTIKDNRFSLDSSNSFCHGLINVSKSVNNFENILEPVDESCMNSENVTTSSNTKSYKLQRIVSKTYEYNNNINNYSVNTQGDTNTSIKMLEESMLDSNKIDFSSENQSLAQNNDCSEDSINKSSELVNIGDFIFMPEMCEDNFANSNDRDEFLDLTKCDYDEIILDHENCTKDFDNVNSDIQTDSEQKTQYSRDSIHETDFESTIIQEGNSSESNEHLDDQESVCETLCNEEKNKFEASNTVDDLLDVDAGHPKNFSQNSFNGKELLHINEHVNEEIMLNDENGTRKTNLEQMKKGTLKRLTIEEEEMLTKLINNEDDKSGKLTDCKDKISVSQTSEDNINEKIFKKLKNQDDLLEVTAHMSDVNACLISEEKSMSQSNNCSVRSIDQSNEFVNNGEILLSKMCDDNVDNSIDQDDILDFTKCENDDIFLDHENRTSVTNEDINCTRDFDNVNSDILTNSEQKTQYYGDSKHETDFESMIIQEGNSSKSNEHLDDQESVCETLCNEEKNKFEASNTVDDLLDVDTGHPQNFSQNNFNGKELLHINEHVNDEIILDDENSTSKTNLEQMKKGTLKRLTIEEEEMLTKLINNEDDKLGKLTDCTDEITVSQTSKDNINEKFSRKLKNQDDLLEVTAHMSDVNACIIEESKKCLPFNSTDARQILENSNDDSEHFDDSLLFKPSNRDLVRYGIECESYEKSISQTLNNLENNVSYKEIIPQCKSLCLKFNEVSKSINNLVSSSYVKDYEDNVIDFYDCELSSIENSDVEDNLLLSFEKDTSMDDCIFDKHLDKMKNTTNSTSNEKTCDNNLKTQNLGSHSESCNNLTNVVGTPVSLINLPCLDHQYNKIISTSISKNQMQMNPDADDNFLESGSHSNIEITSCNTKPSFKDSDNINNIQSNNLCIDQGELEGNFNENQNLEDLNKSHNQNNKNKSISGYDTHQNIKKSRKSYRDNESESSMKITGNCIIPKSNNEEIPKINTVQSSSSNIDKSEIDKKKYIDEIIKNEQLFNKFEEKLDENESAISPFISQSLAKSTNLKSAFAKKAASNININDMGDKALSIYLTQQTMTLDVLKVLHKSLDTCPSSGVLMEDPEGLVVPLMPHQKHAIAWLIWRESQEPHGGILADDMGLGKTLSMISLILKLKEKPQDSLLPVISIDNERNNVIIGGTLVVCPASLINQWETEVKTKLKPGLLKVGQYYGINRNFSALELAKNDLVITSYHVIMWDHKIRQNTSPLYKIKWDRIILDEGHNIRNHKTQTSVAVCSIKSLNRWAITGTPVHNKEADFFTLLKFVRCKPFDDWSVWKRWVGNNDDAGKHRLSLLVKTLMLRRTKTELTQFTTFNLPKKEINTIVIELSKEEQNAYEKLLLFSSNLFATYLYDRAAKENVFDPSIKVQYFQEQNQDKDEVFKDHPELLKLFRQFKNIEEIQTYHILVLLLRLRQICCHPTLIKGPITEESIKTEDTMESTPEDDTCVTNEHNDIDTLPNNIDLSDLMSCLTLEDEPVKSQPVNDIFQKSWISTKIKKICELVNQKVLIDNNQEKAIIVSQWPSFLYLIRKHLAHYNAKIEIFSGTIPISKRNKIIRDFNNPNGGPQILLLSLKAGGVGLNLMAANHMFLVDIHWNPQLEAQACDRVYRLGQTKPVYVYKFICSNTIETRILNIQTHKLQIADNLFKGTNVLSSKISIDDLKQIFQFH